MIAEVTPIRNDLVHGRESRREASSLIPILFGTTFFYEWWHNKNECTTPFTQALQGHMVLQKAGKAS